MIQYYNMDFSKCTVFLKNFLFFFLFKSAAQGADQVYFWYSSAL